MKRNTKTRRTSIISLVMQNYVQMLHPYIFTKSDTHMHIYKHVLSHFSHVQLFVTLWTTAWQAPLSIGFSRQEYWSGLPCLSPEDLPNPGFKLGFSALQVDSLLLGHWGSLTACYFVQKLKVAEVSPQFPFSTSRLIFHRI